MQMRFRFVDGTLAIDAAFTFLAWVKNRGKKDMSIIEETRLAQIASDQSQWPCSLA